STAMYRGLLSDSSKAIKSTVARPCTSEEFGLNILGISCYYHDAAAVLLRDGQLIAAAEEERFTRVKHDYNYPENAIKFCLESGGIRGADVDYVAFFEKPFRKFDRILMTVLQTYPQSYKVFREAMITWMVDKLWVGAKISADLGIPKVSVLRTSFVPCGRRLPVFALRRGGNSHGGRRRRVGDRYLG